MTDQNQSDTDNLVQIIHDNDGKPIFAALPHADFEALMEKARRGAGIDAAADAIRSETNRLALIPSKVVHRIASGEHPVRVWRLHRGLKAVELAREAGISPGYLSEIETSKKDGTFRTMALIAKTLGVRLDDLMPVVDEEEIKEHRQEVQLRDIARLISEIESMINGRGGFDSAAVRNGSQKLMRDAQAFMNSHAGDFGWLEGVVEKAKKIIEEINKAERDIVGTVSKTQSNLSGVFSDSLSRTGLFPKGMAKPKPAAAPVAAAPTTAALTQSPPPPVPAAPSPPENDSELENEDFDGDEEDLEETDGEDEFEEDRKGWFRH